MSLDKFMRLLGWATVGFTIVYFGAHLIYYFLSGGTPR